MTDAAAEKRRGLSRVAATAPARRRSRAGGWLEVLHRCVAVERGSQGGDASSLLLDSPRTWVWDGGNRRESSVSVVAASRRRQRRMATSGDGEFAGDREGRWEALLLYPRDLDRRGEGDRISAAQGGADWSGERRGMRRRAAASPPSGFSLN